mmetsp:Transcript_62422/g.148670  ORF Transcript_62422/g.148670 Transcript_62422/m.148670 type:complete len:343 (-) Transcript_62422:497-1525(-)
MRHMPSQTGGRCTHGATTASDSLGTATHPRRWARRPPRSGSRHSRARLCTSCSEGSARCSRCRTREMSSRWATTTSACSARATRRREPYRVSSSHSSASMSTRSRLERTTLWRSRDAGTSRIPARGMGHVMQKRASAHATRAISGTGVPRSVLGGLATRALSQAIVWCPRARTPTAFASRDMAGSTAAESVLVGRTTSVPSMGSATPMGSVSATRGTQAPIVRIDVRGHSHPHAQALGPASAGSASASAGSRGSTVQSSATAEHSTPARTTETATSTGLVRASKDSDSKAVRASVRGGLPTSVSDEARVLPNAPANAARVSGGRTVQAIAPGGSIRTWTDSG